MFHFCQGSWPDAGKPTSRGAFPAVWIVHFGTIWAKNLSRPKTAAPPSTCKIDQFFGAIPEARRRRLDGLAGLREVIPDVKFADRIEVGTRDSPSCRRLVSSVTGNTPAEKDGMFSHRNCAPRTPCNINGLILLHMSGMSVKKAALGKASAAA
jgi:hypothetical protein